MRLSIATWNINGIKARLETLIEWLKEAEPDLVCMQEIKSIDESFPSERLEELGYEVHTHGQKGFNGVAFLSKHPLEDIERGLPLLKDNDEEDPQARFITARIIKDNLAMRVANLYLPNGNPIDTGKFTYKLSWMKRLQKWAEDALLLEEPLIILGDYNVIPDDRDCVNPKDWAKDALAQPESRQAFQSLKNLGFYDALRSTTQQAGLYTFWDYQAGAWQKNNGIRIDHILMSPQAADHLSSIHIDKHVRDWKKPSDHVPVIGIFK